MKNMLCNTLLIGAFLALNACKQMGAEALPPSLPWFSGELVSWDEKQEEHIRLAKSLGYNCFSDGREVDFPREYAADMKFYLNDPHKNVQPHMSFELSATELAAAKANYEFTFSHWPELPRAIHEPELHRMQKNHPELFKQVKAVFERTKCWHNTSKPFPHNLAQLQQWGSDGKQWEPCTDFQQQAVIDAHVAAIVKYVKNREIPAINCRFEGIVIDVVEIWEEFNYQSDRGLRGHPDSELHTLKLDGVTYDYSTLREGWYVFLGQLRDELEDALGRTIYYIWEPTPIYTKWVKPLETCTYASMTPELFAKVKGDALVNEKPGLGYLINDKLFAGGHWTPFTVGTTSGDLFTKDPYYPLQLKYMGEITVRGGNFFSYGTFDRSRDPVSGYENQFKLIRAVSAWEMMNRTPIALRRWDHGQKTYLSPTAFGDTHALAGLHPKNKKLYAVLLDEQAAVPIAPGTDVSKVWKANEFLEPTAVPGDAAIENGVLRPAPGATFPVSVIADLPNIGKRVFKDNPDLVTSLTEENLYEKSILDPDFEEDAAGWHATGEAKSAIVTDPVQHGRQALRIYNRGKAWHSAAQQINGYLMSNRQGRYTVTAWIRPENRPADFRIGISFINMNERKEFFGAPTPANPGEWTKVTAELDLDWDDWVASGTLTIRSLDTNDPYYLDNVDIDFENGERE